MRRQRSHEEMIVFYQAHMPLLEAFCRSDPFSRKGEAAIVVRLAREELGYQQRTSATDIAARIKRGYLKWRKTKDQVEALLGDRRSPEVRELAAPGNAHGPDHAAGTGSGSAHTAPAL